MQGGHSGPSPAGRAAAGEHGQPCRLSCLAEPLGPEGRVSLGPAWRGARPWVTVVGDSSLATIDGTDRTLSWPLRPHRLPIRHAGGLMASQPRSMGTLADGGRAHVMSTCSFFLSHSPSEEMSL